MEHAKILKQHVLTVKFGTEISLFVSALQDNGTTGHIAFLFQHALTIKFTMLLQTNVTAHQIWSSCLPNKFVVIQLALQTRDGMASPVLI